MFERTRRKWRFLQFMLQEEKKTSPGTAPQTRMLQKNLEANLQEIAQLLGNSSDVGIRKFMFGSGHGIPAAIIYIDGMVDKNIVNNHILRPLLIELRMTALNQTLTIGNLKEILENQVLSVGEIKRAASCEALVEAVLQGNTALVLDKNSEALLIGSKGWEKRGIEEPPSEIVIRGPREGFTETLRVNTAMLRRKIKSSRLVLDSVSIGAQTKTEVVIAYLKGIADEGLIAEIKRRLNRIDTDAILAAGFIEEYIEDNPFSIFATMSYTERPDVVAANILEGRAALLVEGTPFALMVPMLFIESFQSPEDYASRPYFVSLTRMLRFVAFSLSVLSPALYVSLTTFHQEIIPTPLLVTVAAAIEGTPFPTIFETLGMGVVFEILREAGLRLPRPLGQAISIVGALVIGQAAVQAGIIAAPIVVIVAWTAISSFVVPKQVEAGAILRLFFTIAAGFLGLFGISIALIIVLIHLASLRSFGAPYLSPFAPLTVRDLKDTFVRVPLWAMFTRPRVIGWPDPVRQEFRLRPHPPREAAQKNQKQPQRGK